MLTLALSQWICKKRAGLELIVIAAYAEEERTDAGKEDVKGE
jgi:hypothetical protein